MLSFRDALSVFFKRKTIITAFFLTVLAVALITLKLLPPSYAATSKILVKIGREDVYTPAVTPSNALISPMMSMIREEQLNSEVQILTSDNLAEKLVERMTPQGLYPGMFDDHPWYTIKGMRDMVIGIYKGIEGFFAPLSANPTPAQRAMKRFINKDLRVRGTGDSNVIEVTVHSYVPQLSADAANNLVDLYLDERARIHNDVEGGIFAMQMKDIDARLEKAQNDLQTFREQNNMVDVGNERAALLKRVAEARSMIVDLQARPSEAHRMAKWRSELDKLESQMNNLGGQELEYVRLVQDVEVLKKSRQLYLEKLEEHKINTALSTARIGNVSVISHAIAPSAPTGPKLWMVFMAILAVGLLGGMGLAVLIEFLDDTVETDADVRHHLGLPVLGKIAYIG
jgi:uncharacterized protein involved in exopolysaccharide biosynthesis